jgi:CheY-like chemotaxis protein
VDTRTVLQRALRRHQHEVHAVGTAEAALELAARTRLDVVVSDLGLPDRSGLDLMQELHARHGLRGIAVSGYGMEEDVEKSRLAGFEHHLTKPVSIHRLRELLRTMEPPHPGHHPSA